MEGKPVKSPGFFLLDFTASGLASLAKKALLCSGLKAAICCGSGREGRGDASP